MENKRWNNFLLLFLDWISATNNASGRRPPRGEEGSRSKNGGFRFAVFSPRTRWLRSKAFPATEPMAELGPPFSGPGPSESARQNLTEAGRNPANGPSFPYDQVKEILISYSSDVTEVDLNLRNGEKINSKWPVKLKTKILSK